ncbi:unnamed protein product [Linum trigynum]|uniref:Uncharacterized protein n=1 Tax=Linum trigynum TaxID=586398 RepID=A0AAV2CW55_9ROSI
MLRPYQPWGWGVGEEEEETGENEVVESGDYFDDQEGSVEDSGIVTTASLVEGVRIEQLGLMVNFMDGKGC